MLMMNGCQNYTKKLWELQGIWCGLKYHREVLAKYGVHLPTWSWVSFTQVMGIFSKITKVADKVEKEVMHRSRSEWATWAKQATQKGARLAHKVTQNRGFKVCLILNGQARHRSYHNQKMLLMLSWVNGKSLDNSQNGW